MALIKLGSIATHLSGSAGGHTIQKCRSGYMLRNKPQQLFSRTPAQYSIRSLNQTMQHGWIALTDAQRLIWNSYAITKPVFNKSGEKHPLSGHSLWLKYQFSYISNQLPFLQDPSKYLPSPLGPELIDQSIWATPGYWDSLGPGWSADGVKLSCDGTTSGIRKNYFWSNLYSYQSRLSVSMQPGKLYAPYDGLHDKTSIYVSGFYVTFFSMEDPAYTSLWLFSLPFSGSILSLSIKQIL